MVITIIRQEELYPFMLIGRHDTKEGYILTEYENYGDIYEQVSEKKYSNEKSLRKAFSNKLSKLKKLL